MTQETKARIQLVYFATTLLASWSYSWCLRKRGVGLLGRMRVGLPIGLAATAVGCVIDRQPVKG